VGGGLAFWLPAVLLSALLRWNASAVALNAASLAGLALVSLVALARRGVPRWGWALLGVYVLGPGAMFLASAFNRIPTTMALPGDWIWTTVFCLLPPMTLWFAMLNGMIVSVLLATVALPLLALRQSR
jgi:hypothetical protein